MSKPIFQRRHYEAVATVLSETHALAGAMHRGRLVILSGDFTRMFAADNPQFDRARFLKACGVDSNEGR